MVRRSKTSEENEGKEESLNDILGSISKTTKEILSGKSAAEYDHTKENLFDAVGIDKDVVSKMNALFGISLISSGKVSGAVKNMEKQYEELTEEERGLYRRVLITAICGMMGTIAELSNKE